ncbi:MAG: TetM/TetW/TetO/TetS family tetracycline resistance ribosomal protection protein [Bacteroidales bacterium]|nr:TetM/TetW/TetO/TetS family tetracycline resistance ribosomal protection protein [Bacteroidales bacterium]
MKNIRNIAFFAHVDAGKTTITENLLYSTGSIKKKGNVDKGTSQTDFLDIEKEKGISIRVACVSMIKDDVTINLIDTPGHVDFSSETERTMLAIDGAVLIISAVEGVQAHTETLCDLLQSLKIPTIIFINKIDRQGADIEQVIDEINKILTKKTIILQKADSEATNDAEILNIFIKNKDIDTDFIEKIIEQNEILLEKYFDDQELSFPELKLELKKNIKNCDLYPILFGSAKNGIGTTELLDAIIEYLPEPQTQNDKLSGFIYKIEHDKTLGKISHIRLFSGMIRNRETVINSTQKIEEKITQIKKIYTQKLVDIEKIEAGNIAAVTGLSKAQAGDLIGEISSENQKILEHEIPLLTVKVLPKDEIETTKLLEAFEQLTDEDPNLNMQWLNDLRELHINIKGEIQIEILTEILKKRFGINVEFDEPVIIYKETPLKIAEGYVKYWMPKPCWATLRFKIEPAKTGSGVEYKSEVSFDKIKQKYQNQVQEAITISLKQGIKGWEVTDIKITLIDGEDHEQHTHPHDFTVATPMGIMNGLKNSDTSLLEPILNFRITIPEEFLGSIAGDLTKMRATFKNPQFENGKATLTGKIPASTSLDYSIKLASKTGGKGKISTKFDSYQKCTLEEGKTTPFRGISPLDTAKYILHIRNAL